MKRGASIYVISVVLIFLLHPGCCLLKRWIDHRYPGGPPSDFQLKAIDSEYRKLDSFNRIDAYATVSIKDINKHLRQPIKEKIAGLESIKVAGGLQELVVRIGFDKFFKAVNARVKGTAVVHLAVNIADQLLEIQPSFSELKFLKISFSKKRPKRLSGSLTDLVNKVLEEFLDNINGVIKKQKISLDLSVVRSLKPGDIFKNIPHIREVRGNELLYGIKYDKAAVLIDTHGIHILAKFKEHREIIYRAGGPIPGGISFAAPGAVARSFDKFREKFLASGREHLGNEIDESWLRTSALFSKAYLAGFINVFFSTPDFLIIYDFPPGLYDQTFDEEIKLRTAPRIDCDEAGEIDCTPTVDCTPPQDCTPQIECPRCKWYDTRCHKEKLKCETEKIKRRARCQARRILARARCEAEKRAKRLACETKKEAVRVLCGPKKAWLERCSGLKIGRIKGKGVIEGGQARLTVKKLSVTGDLSEISILNELKSDLDVSVDMTFTPRALGNVLCVAQFQGKIRASVGIVKEEKELTAGIKARQGPQGNLILDFETDEQEFEIKTVPDPITALLTQNPHFAIVCAPANLGIKLAALFKIDLLKDTFKYKLDRQKIPIKIKPLTIKVFGEKIKIRPHWGDTAIRFTL